MWFSLKPRDNLLSEMEALIDASRCLLFIIFSPNSIPFTTVPQVDSRWASAVGSYKNLSLAPAS